MLPDKHYHINTPFQCFKRSTPPLYICFAPPALIWYFKHKLHFSERSSIHFKCLQKPYRSFIRYVLFSILTYSLFQSICSTLSIFFQWIVCTVYDIHNALVCYDLLFHICASIKTIKQLKLVIRCRSYIFNLYTLTNI